MVIQEYTIIVAKIKSVEAGSIKTNPTNPVIAFTVEEVINGKSVKVIVKGDQAIAIYDNFLKDGMTRDRIRNDKTTGLPIKLETFVSFKASLKEERAKEIVLENPTNFAFNFLYNVD